MMLHNTTTEVKVVVSDMREQAYVHNNSFCSVVGEIPGDDEGQQAKLALPSFFSSQCGCSLV